jgi:protein O-mannosyl-transferase
LVLVALVLLVYLPALRGGVIWDDNAYVTDNRALRSLEGLRKIWLKLGTTPQYYPMVFTSFWLEYHLWRLQPFGYHLVNVLLHAVNAVLLWRVLRRLEIPGSWWAAAIFALHPVMVESVAWITERKNVLSCLFYLLAAQAYFRFRPLWDGKEVKARDWRFYPLVLVLFLCGLLSKTVTSSLPAALALLVWWKNGKIERRDAVALAPLFVLGAALGSMTAWLEKYHVHASGTEWALSFAQRCLLAARVLWFYAGKLFWPDKLTFIYPRWEIDVGAAWSYLFPAGALAVLMALWLLRLRIGRGPLVAVLFFAGTLAPALGFIDVFPFRYSYVADHFQYLASVGLIALAVGTGAAMACRAGPRGRHLGTLAAAGVLLTLGVLTWRQAHIYQNLETLWRDTLAKNPDAWIAHNNLGSALARAGNLEEAMAHYEEALRMRPDDAETHYNVGLTLAQLGQMQEAIAQYEQALQIKPDYAEAHNNLGNALLQAGQFEQAAGHFEQALQIRPDYAQAHYNLGLALVRLGRELEAIPHWEQAVRLRPDFFEAHGNLGLALAHAGRVREAIGQYEEAVRLKPDSARVADNLARLLATAEPAEGGDPVRAAGFAQRVCELSDYQVANYVDTLAIACAAAGRFDEAIAAAQKAIELARMTGQTQLEDQIQTRLELYRRGRGYR